ncbi:hypothetical protein HPB52_004780 [Rhipicephalus sanguineus]|uniref:Uncharacterized protein n=1 Tax=Rhipicephalus sanguineus TaxID=34632 RepID=A0A9D4SMZ0_RHISA|nr:hypothetical protein HPB52_004780 [Rhipicephalus sanguineus]
MADVGCQAGTYFFRGCEELSHAWAVDAILRRHHLECWPLIGLWPVPPHRPHRLEDVDLTVLHHLLDGNVGRAVDARATLAGWIFLALAPTVNGDPIKNTQPRSSRMDPAGSATNPTAPDAQEDARPSADDLADILASPHTSHPYDTLKAAIISRKSESEHSRLQQLTTATELGDRRPSQLLRRMRQLLGGPSAPQEEKLLRELFLQRLPQSMVPVLVAAGDVPVDTLAEMADRVADYSRAHSLNAVTAPPPATAADPALASIENRLDALVRRLDGFVPAHRRPSSRFQIHSRSSTPPRSPELRSTDAPRDRLRMRRSAKKKLAFGRASGAAQ